MMDREDAAASSIAGLAELYARGERLTWDQATRASADSAAGAGDPPDADR